MTTAYIKNLTDRNGDIVYPQTKTSAIFDSDGNMLSNVMAYKPTIITTILSVGNWNSETKTYSFETEYPNDTYNIDLDFDGDEGTTEQFEAFCASQFVGSKSSNIVKACGELPIIDIPIILFITKK